MPARAAGYSQPICVTSGSSSSLVSVGEPPEPEGAGVVSAWPSAARVAPSPPAELEAPTDPGTAPGARRSRPLYPKTIAKMSSFVEPST